MNEHRPIRNMKDLRRETVLLRRRIAQREQDLSDDATRLLESVTPARIITSVASKLLAGAPAIFTAYSLIRSLFRKHTDPA